MKKILNSGRQILANLARKVKAIASHNPRAMTLAAIMVLSTGAYTADVLINEAKYRLSTQSVQLIGDVNDALADKITLDKNMGAYRFNAENISPEMTSEDDPAAVAAMLSSQKQQTGGGSKDSENLYSLDLPIDPTKGTKIYDANSKTSFKLIPEFAMSAGRSEQGRVVYPLEEGGQAVYSVKGNGVKEDIVLTKPRGDELSFTYKLELPKTLDARLDDRGNLGIYSVDPALSSVIAGALQSGASSTDTERLKDVQENGNKTHLAYLIPAPTIIQSGKQPQGHSAKAVYKLDGDKLTVSTSGLEKLVYPISIDPSVVVTSTSDFTAGNNESNISFDTDAISRATPTAGTVGTWSGATSLSSGRYDHGTVAYGDYLYVLGGNDGVALDEVLYAPINANGTIGTWTATTSIGTARYGQSYVAYNGYMYVMGGTSGSGSSVQVYYAPINSNGTIGSWTETTSFGNGGVDTAFVAYNGYMYRSGGWYFNGSITSVNTVEYAPINANGTIGTWTATTSLTGVRNSHSLIAYNGYLYTMGGRVNGGSYLGTTQYAKINSDGTIGSWITTLSFTTARDEHSSAVYNGYLYIIGGRTGTGAYANDVQYALIKGDGTLGTWQTTNTISTARYGAASAVYNGHIYLTGGHNGTTPLADTQFTKIDTVPAPVFGMSSWATTTILGAGSGSSTAKVVTRQKHTALAYDGYLYVIGGQSNTTPTATVHYAPINANGTIGTWVVSANPLPATRESHMSVIVNGYMYVIAGTTSGGGSNAVLYSQIGVGGLNGTWTTTTAAGIAFTGNAATSYNGYIYITGGSGYVNSVHYALVGSNGAPGTWTAGTVLPAGLMSHMAVAYNGYLYVLGGAKSGGTSTTVYYAPISADGSLGSWDTTTSTNYLLQDTRAYVYEGHIIVNGFNDGSNNIAVTYAKINANGTIGSWGAATTTYTPGRGNYGSTMYNGYLYTIGGIDNGTVRGDVLYAQMTYDRASMSTTGTTSLWQATTSTNLAVYGQTSAVYNGYVYIIGGYGSAAYRNDIRYAPFNSDGSIGSWTTSPSTMALARFNGAAVAYKGYLYVTGGQQAAGVFTNTVEYAAINANGSLGSWQTSGNAFTTARYGHVTIAYNGKLYVIGGGDAANVALGDVKYATINTDGSISTWTNTTATVAARDTDGFVYGGRLYILGGLNGTTYSNIVRYAKINTDGTLAGWTTAPYQFATARSRHAAIASNGYMYISGGGTASPFGDLQYAPINVDGSVGPWKTSNSLSAVGGAPAGYYYHSMVAYRGRLYSLAGNEGTGTAQSASYMTALNTSALNAFYSKSFNLGQESTLNSIVTNGTFPIDQNNIMFRVAGSNGTYGSWQLPSVLSGAPISNVQYVMYKVNMDDSDSSSFFEVAGGSTVTDITVDYTLPVVPLSPENRLRQNKYFDGSGVLQPLQTQ